MSQGKKTKAAQKRKWYTMTELRELPDAELDELVKSFGCPDETLAKYDHADKLVYVMNNQFALRDKGVEFEKGGQK